MSVTGVVWVAALSFVATAGANEPFVYVSPKPGARFVAPGTTLIFRPDPSVKAPGFPALEARGSKSGAHGGRWIAAEEGTVLIFRPDRPFASREIVNVTIERAGLQLAYRFETSPPAPPVERDCAEPCPFDHPVARAAPGAASRSAGGLSLPSSLNVPTITVNDDPSPGNLFLGPFAGNRFYLLMLANDGSPAFFRELPEGRPWDFKKHENVGLYSYLQRGEDQYEVVDEGFDLVNTYSAGNGYPVLDEHDLQILDSGNVLLGIKDYQIVDMSQIVEGGNPNATVVGLVLQEQDAAHNVVFQWRSWDHLQITDATHLDFTAETIDYVHFNAVEPDTDGNLLISARTQDAIVKIDRQTGEVIWRLGGSRNEFTLFGDTIWFSRQHAIRRTSTGTVTMFDNGNYNTPRESRAVEYALDEFAKTATRVWEFRNDPPLYGVFVGNAQRLPTGNTLISWGPLGIVTEVRPDGTKAFEAVLEDTFTYRAFRHDWIGPATRPELWFEVTSFEVRLHFTKFGDPEVTGYNVYTGEFPEPTTLAGSTPDNTFVIPVSPLEHLYVRVTAVDSTGGESPYSNEVLIVVPVATSSPEGTAVGAQLALPQNHPNPFTASTTVELVLPARQAVELSIYDVSGRLVRRLVEGVVGEGRSEIVWDGLDEAGRRAGSGVYFCRAVSAGVVTTRRMTLRR